MKTCWSLSIAILVGCAGTGAPQERVPNSRRPSTDAELKSWLVNMVGYHRFTPEEVRSATGMSVGEIRDALERFAIKPGDIPPRDAHDPLVVLPYPGGRHPRIGFLEGAIEPQRETKVSVFTPWHPEDYVVVDVPEAIWSNLGLTYLAHTHVPTVWTRARMDLDPTEWKKADDGTLTMERTLPNGIAFGTKIKAGKDAVLMDLWLKNGSTETLTGLRVQNCIMLKGARDFNRQIKENKYFQGPYAACKSDDGKRWVITAWEMHHRNWANTNCPCVHSDPVFPDCPRGQTRTLKGWLSFYEGTDIKAEIARIEKTGWRAGIPKMGKRSAAAIRGEVRDEKTNEIIPSRVYIRSDKGGWFHPVSSSGRGSAVRYTKKRTNESQTYHTTLTAHPWVAELPPGTYTVTVERGKEYLPVTREVTVAPSTQVKEVFTLKRWINMADRGWYSGDTHTHRTMSDLPNVIQAEDLNVAFPLNYWVTKGYAPPGTSQKTLGGFKPELVEVDPTHVIYPLNTEYEIFTIDGKRHTLGAVFMINHQKVFELGVPPVGPVLKEARAQGSLLELDKHNWPWSMAIVPIMNVDLFELTNNHLWRTSFAFKTFGEKPAPYMNIESNDDGYTEKGWIHFGFQNYYALLNCGFRMRPTAGTASGVHPVPLGFGRVYVHQPDGFSYDGFVKGLDAGRSFVTTGPMVFVTVNGKDPGHMFKGPGSYTVSGEIRSGVKLSRIELIVNGEVARTIEPQNTRDGNAFVTSGSTALDIAESSWIAVRAFEEHPGGRIRFGHTGPVHIDVAGKPLRPRKVEVDYLIQRVQAQIDRSSGVLPAAAIEEYKKALSIYKKVAETAKP